MKKTIYYLSVFLLFVVVFIVLSAPAHLFKPYIPKDLVSIAQLEGHLISGQAKQVVLSPQLIAKFFKGPLAKSVPTIERINWDINLWSFLLLQLSNQFNITTGRLSLSGQLTYDLSKSLTLDKLAGKLEASTLLKQLGYELAVSGVVIIRDAKLSLKGQKLTQLSSNISLDRLVIFDQKIGRINAKVSLKEDKQQLLFELSSTASESKILVDGVLTLGLNGDYQTNIRLTPVPNISKDLTDMLSLVGQQSGKSRLVKLTGKL